MNVTFITGNQNKADYLARFIGMELAHQKVELDEIQSTSLRKIAEHKAKHAYEIVGNPVLIEDISLEFHALDNLPGPFVRFFVDAENDAELLCRMLDGFDDRSATVRCTYAIYDGKRLEFVEQGAEGMIAEHPRGSAGYGWDSIFELEGFGGKTNSELEPEGYEEFQWRLKPFDKLKTALEDFSR